MFSAHVGPWHEFADLVCGVTICKRGECLREPGVRIDAGDFAVFDQRGDDRPVVAAFVGACEQRVLAIEGERSDRAFDRVGIDIDLALS